MEKIMEFNITEIATALGFIYLGLLYFLPPEYAKKLEPLGKFLQFLAKTPKGFKNKN